jgi:hypothetical protein
MQQAAAKKRLKDFDEEIDSDLAEDIDESEIKEKPRLGKSL